MKWNIHAPGGAVAASSFEEVWVDSERDAFVSASEVWLDPRPSSGAYLSTTDEAQPAPVPPKVTARQAIQALISVGVFEEDVEAVIDAIPDATQQRIARNFWRRSNDFERTNPTLNSLAPALGLSQSQLDDLFRLAASY